jgi:lipopolysaccharide transport system ATP-binding protein
VPKPSVVVEGVSKKFGLSLRSALKYGLIDSGRRLLGKEKDSRLRPGEFWALDDVSFVLEPGDALGIMGVNGSGKTTLLRILNGTYSPDKGKVTLRGRIGALIAAGAGFSPMLSGRENVYISGALLGMTPSEIRNKFDEIVAFAQLGEFIDMPVRNYSSGMSVRLGFAIAVIGSPDILLVDEVLAVGDMNFQKKCYERIQTLRREGTTILLVSHAPGAIWAVCTRGLFLNGGCVVAAGAVEDVIRAYDDQNSRSSAKPDPQHGREEKPVNKSVPNGEATTPMASDYGNPICGTGDVICRNFRFSSLGLGHTISEVEFLEPFALEFDMEVVNYVEDMVVRVVGDSVHYRNILTLDSYEQGSRVERMVPGRYTIRAVIDNQKLRPGAYTFHVGVIRKQVALHLFLWLKCGQLVVLSPKDRFLYSDPFALIHMDAQFTFSPVRVAESCHE